MGALPPARFIPNAARDLLSGNRTPHLSRSLAALGMERGF